MAFDMHQWMYQAFHRNGADARRALRDVDLFARCLKTMGVTGTFVFDGDTVGLKPRAHRQRAEASEAAMDTVATEELELTTRSYSGLEDFHVACEALCKRKAQASKPPRWLFEESKALLAKYGTVTVAMDDAERLVAFLARTGQVDHAVSKDYDTLVFGAPELVLDFPFAGALVGEGGPGGDEDDSCASVLVLDTVLKGLDLASLAQLQDLAILAGCDYTEKIPGIGAAIAHRLIRTHKTIERAIAVGAIKAQVPPAFNPVFARCRFRGEDITRIVDSVEKAGE